MFKLSYKVVLFCWITSLPALPALAQAPAPQPPQEWGEITPAHVFQKTQDIIAQIELLQKTIGVDHMAQEPEPQSFKTPIQTYAKGLEVMRKVAEAERKLGMAPVPVPQLPLREVIPADVLQLCEAILLELDKMRQQLAVADKAPPAPFIGGKTMSHVYENLWLASNMLDGLVGRSLTTQDYLRNIEHINQDMELIAAKLKTSLELPQAAVEIKERKGFKEVAQQALLDLYKIANLQTRLGMDTFNLPNMTLARVTPADVYDLTNIMMAEINRIKVHLEILVPTDPPPAMNTTLEPGEAYYRMKLLGSNLNKLIETVATQKKS